jgi:hypothetical protein
MKTLTQQSPQLTHDSRKAKATIQCVLCDIYFLYADAYLTHPCAVSSVPPHKMETHD